MPIYDTPCSVTADLNRWLRDCEQSTVTDTCKDCGADLAGRDIGLHNQCYLCRTPCKTTGCSNRIHPDSEADYCAACALEGARYELIHGTDDEDSRAYLAKWEAIVNTQTN